MDVFVDINDTAVCFVQICKFAREPMGAFTFYSSLTDHDSRVLFEIARRIDGIPDLIVYTLKRQLENSFTGGIVNKVEYMYNHQFKTIALDEQQVCFETLFNEVLPRKLENRMRSWIIPRYLDSLRAAPQIKELKVMDILYMVDALTPRDIKIIENNCAGMMLSTINSSNTCNLQLSSDQQQSSLSIKHKKVSGDDVYSDVIYHIGDAVMVGRLYVPHNTGTFYNVVLSDVTDTVLKYLMLREVLHVMRVVSFSGTHYNIEAFVMESRMGLVQTKCANNFKIVGMKPLPVFKLADTIQLDGEYQYGSSIYRSDGEVFEFSGIGSKSFLDKIANYILCFKVSQIVNHHQFQYLIITATMKYSDINLFYKLMILGMTKSHRFFEEHDIDSEGNAVPRLHGSVDSGPGTLTIFDEALEQCKGFNLFCFSYPKFLQNVRNLIFNVIDDKTIPRDEVLESDIFRAIIKNRVVLLYMNATKKNTPHIANENDARNFAAITVQVMSIVYYNLVEKLEVDDVNNMNVNEIKLRSQTTLNSGVTGLNSLGSVRPIGNITNVHVRNKKSKLITNSIAHCLNAPLCRGSEASKIILEQ